MSAKRWVLMSPEGVTYQVRNLSLFARKHAADYDSTPDQMRHGIYAIKQWYVGARKHPAESWKGWRLLEWEP